MAKSFWTCPKCRKMIQDAKVRDVLEHMNTHDLNAKIETKPLKIKAKK